MINAHTFHFDLIDEDLNIMCSVMICGQEGHRKHAFFSQQIWQSGAEKNRADEST